LDQSQLDAIRAALDNERESIERQLSEYGAEAGGDGFRVSMDEGFADSAQVTAERSELLSLVEQLRAGHDEVVGALRRVDEGTYGKCERCGEEIPVERLEAIPTARLCMRCKQAMNHA
jgi:DnaK suppressor protein